jgi:hypothetical protein
LIVFIEKQGVRTGSTSSSIVQPLNLPLAHEAGSSEPLTPINRALEVSSDSTEKEAETANVVSFDDEMDAVERAADAFEDSVLSWVSDPDVHRRLRRLARVLELATCRTTLMSFESSDTEYNSESQISIAIDGPILENTCQCDCSTIQGRQEVVIIHLSSNSEEDVDID